MIRLHKPIVFLIILLVITGISNCSFFGENIYRLSGTVVDADGEGIEDVLFHFSGEHGSTTSDGNGHWSMTELEGMVTITPVKEDWNFYPKNITVYQETEELIFEGREKQKEIIGTAGGEIILTDGKSSLTIPESSLAEEQEIRYSEAISGLSGIVGSVYELGPAGIEFDPPALLTLDYTDILKLDVTPEELVIGKIVNGSWEELETSLDQNAGTVSAEISCFSIYAIGTAEVEDEETDFIFADGDYALYSLNNKIGGEEIFVAQYQWEVCEISYQEDQVIPQYYGEDNELLLVNIREITQISTSLLDEADDLPEEFNDFNGDNLEQVINNVVSYSSWEITDRNCQGYSFSEDENAVGEELYERELSTFLWIPTDITAGEKVLIADLELSARGPVSINLPDIDKDFEAWEFVEKEDNLFLTFYYDTELGALLMLKIEDLYDEEQKMSIELQYKDSSLTFQGHSGNSPGKITVAEERTTAVNKAVNKDKVSTQGLADHNWANYYRQQLQDDWSYVIFEPPYTFADFNPGTPQYTALSVFELMGAFDRHLIYPDEETGVLDIDIFGAAALGVTARSEPFAFFEEEIYVCGEKGETGQYEVAFFYTPQVYAELNSSESLISDLAAGTDEVLRNPPSRLRNLVKLIPRGVNHGRVGVLAKAYVFDKQRNLLAEEKQWIIEMPGSMPQAGMWWDWSEYKATDDYVNMVLNLEADKNYYLRFEVLNWVWLHAYGYGFTMSGTVKGDVSLPGVGIYWEGCQSPIIRMGNNFDQAEHCPAKLQIEGISEKTVNEPFDLKVYLLNAKGNPVSLEGGPAPLTLSVDTGTGNLGGLTERELLPGESSVIFEDIYYDRIEDGVVLQVAGGNILCKLDSELSNHFNVRKEEEDENDDNGDDEVPEVIHFDIQAIRGGEEEDHRRIWYWVREADYPFVITPEEDWIFELSLMRIGETGGASTAYYTWWYGGGGAHPFIREEDPDSYTDGGAPIKETDTNLVIRYPYIDFPRDQEQYLPANFGVYITVRDSNAKRIGRGSSELIYID